MVPAKPHAPPFVNSLLLLVIAAGVLNIDLFEVDGYRGDGRGSLYRLELVLDTSKPAPGETSVTYNAPHRDEVKAVVAYAAQYPARSGVLALVPVATKERESKAPSFRSSYHASAFTIPHQNPDEDETSPVPAAAAV